MKEDHTKNIKSCYEFLRGRIFTLSLTIFSFLSTLLYFFRVCENII